MLFPDPAKKVGISGCEAKIPIEAYVYREATKEIQWISIPQKYCLEETIPRLSCGGHRTQGCG